MPVSLACLSTRRLSSSDLTVITSFLRLGEQLTSCFQLSPSSSHSAPILIITERSTQATPPTFRGQNLIENRPHLRAGCWPLPRLGESGDERFVVLHWAYLQKMCRPEGGFKSQYLVCLLKALSFVLYKFCKVFLKKRKKLWEDLSCCETYNVSLMTSYTNQQCHNRRTDQFTKFLKLFICFDWRISTELKTIVYF